MTNFQPPNEIPAGFERHTNREYEEVHQAVVALSERRLEGLDSAGRVAKLRRLHLAAPYQVVQDLRAEIIAEFPVPEGWDSERLPIGIQEARLARINEMLAQTQDIPAIPRSLYLTAKDLPRAIKGEAGDMNQMAVAQIIDRLGWLYALEPEEQDGTRAQEG